MAHARDMLEQARQDAENHAREAEEATLEARSLKEELEESREEIRAREAKAKGAEEAVKVCPVVSRAFLSAPLSFDHLIICAVSSCRCCCFSKSF